MSNNLSSHLVDGTTLANRPNVKIQLTLLCGSPMCSPWSPRLPGCYLGSTLKLASGKSFGPWWNRERFQSLSDSMLHSSHRFKPILAIVWIPTNNCSWHTLMFFSRRLFAALSHATFANAKVCHLKAWLAWQQHSRTSMTISKLVCLFINNVPCLETFA